ncbi:MAG: penicillin acylase family protein [Luteimonas sp.]
MSRLVLFVLCPLAVVGVSAGTLLLRSLPLAQGEFALEGLQAPVTIARDRWGVPDIRAESDHDAFFALGYVHAQDRMWQMDYKRRLGQGRLSEILGAKSLNSDKLMRTLGVYRAARQALAALPAVERASLRAYADGVNAWIDSNPPLPVEYRYFGLRPERWSEADSLLMIKLLALNLGANYRQELANQMLIKQLGADAAGELLDVDLRADAVVQPAADAPAAAALFGLSGGIERAARLGGDGAGSNAWAVSGAHTRDGLPLLAGDPHLRVQLPSTFYLARLRGHRLQVSGATLPGLPVVVFGHNAHVAWTGTNLAADAQDLYVERMAIDREQYAWQGQWRDLQVREEWIRVAPEFPASLRKPYKPMRWLARSTLHGPLISDVFGGSGPALSLRWAALDRSDPSFKSFLAINYARDLTQFRTALRDHAAPALTFVYADKANNIALLAAGRIPVRRAGRGLLPAPGWDAGHGWERYLTPEELPAQINPASGRVVSANQRIHLADDPHVISNSWQPSYRAQRIQALLQAALAGGRKLGPEDFARMQGDVYEPQAAELRPWLARLQPATARQRELLARLRAWDGTMARDSVGATLYHAWSRHFMRDLIAQRLQVELVHGHRLEALQDQLDTFRPQLLRRVVTGQASRWCGSRERRCETLALAALDEAATELTRLLGVDIDDWRWGDAHQVHLPHAPFTQSAFLGPLFDRRGEVAGGRYTVNVSGSEFHKDRGYVSELGAAYRQIIPLGDLRGSRFVIDSGQSGHAVATHYADQMPLHRDGQAIAAADRSDRQVLVLRPRRPGATQP